MLLWQPSYACVYVCECAWNKRVERSSGLQLLLAVYLLCTYYPSAASKNSSVNHASSTETAYTPLYIFSRDPDVSN